MNDELNLAVAEVLNGNSDNHYLTALLVDQKIRSIGDLASYANKEFWSCVLDVCPDDPVEVVKGEVLPGLRDAANGKISLKEIDAHLDRYMGKIGDHDQFYDFAEALADELDHLRIAIKYLLHEQGGTTLAA